MGGTMRAVLAAFAATCALAGQAAAFPKPQLPAPVRVSPLPTGATPKPLKLTRAVIALKDGDPWHYDGGNFACSLSGVTYRWSSESTELNVERFQTAFEEELFRAGFAKSISNNLFDTGSGPEGLEVGLKVTDIKSFLCAAFVGSIKDTMLIKTEWQIYDPIRREILFRIQTIGGTEKAVERVKGPRLRAS